MATGKLHTENFGYSGGERSYERDGFGEKLA